MAAADSKLKSDNNILWLADNVDTLEGFQAVYARFHALQNNPKVPWILLNVCCSGSEDASFSSAIVSLLMSSKKEIRTQVITAAQSYGVIFACIGSERKAWPDAEFMHHSFHLSHEHVSIEELDEQLKQYKKAEKKTLDFMKKQMGDLPFKNFYNDFKKNGCKDMDFNANKAVEYNVVHEIGMIEPVFF